MSDVGIVAYLWHGGVWCPDCVGTHFRGMPSMMRLPVADVEALLDAAADARGIDRSVRSSYTSSEFPKPTPGGYVDDDEHCCNCEDCINHAPGSCGV